MLRIARDVVATACLLAAGTVAASTCPPPDWSAERLTKLRAARFALDDGAVRQALAVELLPCLADPDPALRDAVAFEGLSTWLRAGDLDESTRRTLLQQLLPKLKTQDPAGFAAPFAALALSEVVRTDRIAPWMRPAERSAVATAAAAYLAGVRDYRGFTDGEGWRHGVAHGADLVLQLALDPAVADADLSPLLAALGAQVAPERHAYVHGEPERLARAALYLARRPGIDDATWQAWFDALMAPAPWPDWEAALGSEAGLARRHNLHAFLLALHVAAEGSDDPAWQALDGRTRQALQRLP